MEFIGKDSSVGVLMYNLKLFEFEVRHGETEYELRRQPVIRTGLCARLSAYLIVRLYEV